MDKIKLVLIENFSFVNFMVTRRLFVNFCISNFIEEILFLLRGTKFCGCQANNLFRFGLSKVTLVKEE